MNKQNITLYYREGSSDKVYQAAVEASNGGYVVNFAYGRRGSALTAGTKTPAPVTLEQATKIYNKLVKEKTGKGYHPGEDAPAYAGTDNEDRDTGLRPQLLNAIDEEKALALLEDDAYVLQEKYDGRRTMIRKTESGDVIGSNRKGLAVALPEAVIAEARKVSGAFVVDGELMGEYYVAFDSLERNSDLRAKGVEVRTTYLAKLIDEIGNSGAGAFRVSMGFGTKKDKEMLFNLILKKKGEGVVFKRKGDAYFAGQPAAGQPPYKFKFTASATCVINAITPGKRSVELAVFTGDGSEQAIGRVTIPANKDIPAVGAIVEVKYLYWYPGGSLFQPVFLGERDDVGKEACTIAQLKVKQGEEESIDGE